LGVEPSFSTILQRIFCNRETGQPLFKRLPVPLQWHKDLSFALKAEKKSANIAFLFPKPPCYSLLHIDGMTKRISCVTLRTICWTCL